jgi:VIT1/CCC1 family predicted Fe2+/Mn2+ transporter
MSKTEIILYILIAGVIGVLVYLLPYVLESCLKNFNTPFC